jgi:uncharacterized membrane protein YfcA
MTISLLLMSTPDEVAGVGMTPSRKIAAGIGIGACIGFLGGMLGIGGGVFVVPLVIYILKTPTKIAAASSTFIVCFEGNGHKFLQREGNERIHLCRTFNQTF